MMIAGEKCFNRIVLFVHREVPRSSVFVVSDVDKLESSGPGPLVKSVRKVVFRKPEGIYLDSSCPWRLVEPAADENQKTLN